MAIIAAKPARSTAEKAVPSQTAEKMVAETGSVAASMEDFTGPTSWMPCMNRVKESTVPNSTMAMTASQPRTGRSTWKVQLRAARLMITPPTSMPQPLTTSRPQRPMSRLGSRV